MRETFSSSCLPSKSRFYYFFVLISSSLFTYQINKGGGTKLNSLIYTRITVFCNMVSVEQLKNSPTRFLVNAVHGSLYLNPNDDSHAKNHYYSICLLSFI